MLSGGAQPTEAAMSVRMEGKVLKSRCPFMHFSEIPGFACLTSPCCNEGLTGSKALKGIDPNNENTSNQQRLDFKTTLQEHGAKGRRKNLQTRLEGVFLREFERV
ncbi:hypothetical protein NHP194003_11250 [Helicobacter suis]|nr:hypothetical protein NHP194003_11250 [Helicobacter suis]